MSNSLDPGQARHFVGPDLGPNCLQMLSTDGTSRQRVDATLQEGLTEKNTHMALASKSKDFLGLSQFLTLLFMKIDSLMIFSGNSKGAG